MSTKIRGLLLATNGAPESLPSLHYGAWLAKLLKIPVTLLGLRERGPWRNLLPEAMASAEAELQTLKLNYSVVFDEGRAEKLLTAHAEGDDNLVVFGPMGRSVWTRLLRGRSLRRSMLGLRSPYIYTRNAPQKLEHALVCAGGLGYSLHMLETALTLASRAKAAVTLMHILEPVDYKYPTARQLQLHENDLLHSETPQGRNLQAAMTMIEERGVQGTLLVRQGYVVQEIYKAAASGDFNLIGLGSHHSGRGLRHQVTPNITAEVAEHVALPILVAGGDIEKQ